MRRSTTRVRIHVLLIALLGVIVLMASGAPDYTETVRIVGVDAAGNLVVVQLDAAGNITAVLQAEYGGVLQTLACDAEGRLVAVIDDGDNLFDSQARVGNAELAVRLDSINTYERRGTTVFAESFEQGLLRWIPIHTGIGASIVLTSDNSKSGGYAVHLTAGSTATHQADIEHREKLLSMGGLLGLESSFRNLDADAAFYEMSFEVDDGVDAHLGIVRWGMALDRVWIWHGGAFELIIDGAFGGSGGLSWSTMKVVLDPTTMAYDRLYFNGLEVDISAYSLVATGGTAGRGVDVYLRVVGEDGENSEYLVDNFILTTNEPEE